MAQRWMFTVMSLSASLLQGLGDDSGLNKQKDLELFDLIHPHSVKVISESYKYINVTWMSPNSNVSDINNYILYYMKSNNGQNPPCPSPNHNALEVDSNVTVKVIKGLKPGTRYGICIQANYTTGDQPYSPSIFYTTLGYGPDNMCNCTITKYVDVTNPCQPTTGHCNCNNENLAGPKCDSCKEKYFMDAGLGCLPCHCTSVHSTGRCSKYQGVVTKCECIGDYGGVKCDSCKVGYYMDSNVKKCVPCQCNNNSRPGSHICDQYTGECTPCWYNTTGEHCETCKEGFTGSATNRNCTKIIEPPVEETSAFREISFIVIICLAVAVVFIIAAVLIIYCLRKAKGKPFSVWTVKYRDEVSFSPVVDQQPDLFLLNDDGVQYFERDSDTSPTGGGGGGRLQLQLSGNQIYKAVKS